MSRIYILVHEEYLIGYSKNEEVAKTWVSEKPTDREYLSIDEYRGVAPQSLCSCGNTPHKGYALANGNIKWVCTKCQ